MKMLILPLLSLICIPGCTGQKKFGAEHLTLEKVIEMPGVKGRIDHLAVNLRTNTIYVAALGNNSVEVVNLNKGSVIHSIKGFDEPQGVAYIPETDELVVANGGDGNCDFYNASTYDKRATINLGADADNIRYDPINKMIYVGYGNGSIAVINIIDHKRISDIKLPAHPESFQINQKHNHLVVNLPDDNSIAIIDLKSFRVISTWTINNMKSNFPMTLDTASNSVFIGFRRPAVLVCYNALTGQEKGRNELVGDVDDVFYYPAKQEVFATGGSGSINIFKKENDSICKKIANIPTREGARTSLLVPSLQTLILAERNSGGKPAALAVYKIND
jgi:hypothetical protein